MVLRDVKTLYVLLNTILKEDIFLVMMLCIEVMGLDNYWLLLMGVTIVVRLLHLGIIMEVLCIGNNGISIFIIDGLENINIKI